MEEVRIYTKRWPGDGALRVIKIEGFLDTTTSQSLAKRLDELLDQEIYRIVIDLEAVDYISSPGWGILVGDIRRIRESGGDLKLAQMKPEVYEIYALLGLDSFIESYGSVEEACAQFAELPLAIEQPIEPEAVLAQESESVSQTETEETDVEEEKPEVAVERPAPEEPLTLAEMIREIVEEHPDFNTWKVKRELDSERYNYTKASWFKVYRGLRHFRRGLIAAEQRRLEIQEKRLQEMRDDFDVERRLWEAERRLKLQKDELEKERLELEAMKREFLKEREAFRQEMGKRHSGYAYSGGIEKARRAKWMTEILTIVRRNPEYGAKRISGVLEAEHMVSRSPSTIYAKLRRANLNTREKRVEFAEGEREDAEVQS
jgi:anti-sigma B factor antagonist